MGLDVEFISDMRHDNSEVALVQAWLPAGAPVAAQAGKRARGGKSGKKGQSLGWLNGMCSVHEPLAQLPFLSP
jgi:hypothetical protein